MSLDTLILGSLFQSSLDVSRGVYFPKNLVRDESCLWCGGGGVCGG